MGLPARTGEFGVHFGGEGLRGAVLEAIGEDDGASGCGDLDAGGEGEDVDDDYRIADRGQLGDGARSPFAADVEFALADFQRISDSTPFLADLKPSGKYLMEDVHDAGGIPAVMKYMLEEGLLNGDCSLKIFLLQSLVNQGTSVNIFI